MSTNSHGLKVIVKKLRVESRNYARVIVVESPESRRRTMQAIRSKNTKPEMAVRRMLHAKGYRYRLHRKDLPGSPDLVFQARKKVIFVNGCFWHGHSCKDGSRTPKTNSDYWGSKRARNMERDAENLKKLAELGWQILIIWECELKDENLSDRLVLFLG